MGPLLTRVTTIMQKSFPVLTHLDLKWETPAFGYAGGLSIPGRLLDGSAPCLQYLRLKCISFPQLPMFLLSTHNLVTLKLKDISNNDLISPEVTVRCLAMMTGLTTLSITFDDAMSPPNRSESRPYLSMRTILPALTRFHYGGYGKYLEDFLAQINTPQLRNLRIKYDKPQIEAPQLSHFIDRTASLKLNRFRHATVDFYPGAIDIQLDCSQDCRQAQLSLAIFDVSCLDEQVPCVVDVLGRLVAIFSNIDHLSADGDDVESREMESADWLRFFRLFRSVKTLHLSGGVAAYIVSALEETAKEMVTDVFPELHSIRLEECDDYVPSMEGFLSFRQLSGYPVPVVVEVDRRP
jgi:hypothetical protein